MYITLEITSFHASEKERVTFYKITSDGAVIGRIMLTTTKEECPILTHELIAERLGIQ